MQRQCGPVRVGLEPGFANRHHWAYRRESHAAYTRSTRTPHTGTDGVMLSCADGKREGRVGFPTSVPVRTVAAAMRAPWAGQWHPDPTARAVSYHHLAIPTGNHHLSFDSLYDAWSGGLIIHLSTQLKLLSFQCMIASSEDLQNLNTPSKCPPFQCMRERAKTCPNSQGHYTSDLASVGPTCVSEDIAASACHLIGLQATSLLPSLFHSGFNLTWINGATSHAGALYMP